MKVVVVYESMFGNTKTVAEGIADGLREAGEVALGTVDDLSPEESRDATLIVVGGPTQARHVAKQNARQSAAKNHAVELVRMRLQMNRGQLMGFGLIRKPDERWSLHQNET